MYNGSTKASRPKSRETHCPCASSASAPPRGSGGSNNPPERYTTACKPPRHVYNGFRRTEGGGRGGCPLYIIMLFDIPRYYTIRYYMAMHDVVLMLLTSAILCDIIVCLVLCGNSLRVRDLDPPRHHTPRYTERSIRHDITTARYTERSIRHDTIR